MSKTPSYIAINTDVWLSLRSFLTNEEKGEVMDAIISHYIEGKEIEISTENGMILYERLRPKIENTIASYNARVSNLKQGGIEEHKLRKKGREGLKESLGANEYDEFNQFK